jgi:hypothetical protein
LFAYGMLKTFRLRLDQDGALIAPAIPVIEEFCSVVKAEADRLGFHDNYVRRARRRIAELKLKLDSVRPNAPADQS